MPVIGLNAVSSPTIPQYCHVIGAREVVMYDAAGTCRRATNLSNITAGLPTTGGPYQNVHVYFIHGDAASPTDSVVFSFSDPSAGPALPAGYTHWAYAYSLRCDGSGTLPHGITVRGNKVFFGAFSYQTVYDWGPPSGGVVNPTSVQHWHFVPDIADQVSIWWDAEVLTTGSVNIDFCVLGQAAFSFQISGGQRVAQNFVLDSPTNPGMAVPVQFYSRSYAGVSQLFLGYQIVSYTVSNGG